MLKLFHTLSGWPLWLLHSIGAALGWITYWTSPSYRRRFNDNVLQAGIAPHEARPAIAAAGRMVAELPFLWLRPAGVPIKPKLDWVGAELITEALQARRGIVLLTPHMGSFEVMHSLSRRKHGLRVAMAMYEENARKIGGILSAINPNWVADIVALGQIDAMLNIAERLDQGAYVGVLADRTLGEEPAQSVAFLGQESYVPTGPMRAAAILRCPVFFMAGLYRGGNKYHVVFERVADFSATSVGSRDLAVRAAIERYVAVLERYCRSDPYNWFNFFDFWAKPGGSGRV